MFLSNIDPSWISILKWWIYCTIGSYYCTNSVFCETQFTTYQQFVANKSAISPFLGCSKQMLWAHQWCFCAAHLLLLLSPPGTLCLCRLTVQVKSQICQICRASLIAFLFFLWRMPLFSPVSLIQVFLNLSSSVHVSFIEQSPYSGHILLSSLFADFFPSFCHTILVLAHLIFCWSSSNRLLHPTVPRRLLIFIVHRTSFQARLLPSQWRLLAQLVRAQDC